MPSINVASLPVIPYIGLLSEHTAVSAYAVKTADVYYLLKIKFVLSIVQHLLAEH